MTAKDRDSEGERRSKGEVMMGKSSLERHAHGRKASLQRPAQEGEMRDLEEPTFSLFNAQTSQPAPGGIGTSAELDLLI